MGSDVNLTTPVPCGSYHASTGECSKGNINIWEDPYFIGAVVCFCLGGLLFLLGFGRLIWYLAQPKKKRKRFTYIVQLIEPNETNMALYARQCKEFDASPVLWY